MTTKEKAFDRLNNVLEGFDLPVYENYSDFKEKVLSQWSVDDCIETLYSLYKAMFNISNIMMEVEQ